MTASYTPETESSIKIKIKKELGVGKAGVLRSEAVLRFYDRDAIGLSGITV